MRTRAHRSIAPRTTDRHPTCPFTYDLDCRPRRPDAFLALLTGAGIECVVDVRRYPGSRRHPHFAADVLAASLNEIGIGYRWLGEELGGRGRGGGHSGPWRNPAFAAYVAHTETPECARGLDQVKRPAESQRVVVLCSETLWWRCHRRLIAEALIAEALIADGFVVEHLVTPGRPAEEHRTMTPKRRAWHQDRDSGGGLRPSPLGEAQPADGRAIVRNSVRNSTARPYA